MTNNIDIIKPLLSFDSEDEFYFVQILKRKKDNPDFNRDCSVIKSYCVRSMDYLDAKIDEMIFFANHFNARVTIRLNKRSYKKAALHMISELAKSVSYENYRIASSLFYSAAGHVRSGDKLWLVDVDHDDLHHADSIISDIGDMKPLDRQKFIAKIPSKTGTHIVTKPFDLANFKVFWPKLTIQKDNPTNLYIP